MKATKTWETDTKSSEQTEDLASRIGANLRGGEVIELVSDLGGGKTTFTRGLVRGAGSSDKVSSPTFTLSQEYVTPKFKIAHFDFYRLDEAGVVANELAEMVRDHNVVTVIEWGDIVHNVLPENRVTIWLQLQRSGDEDRTVVVSYPDELEYLLENIQ